MGEPVTPAASSRTGRFGGGRQGNVRHRTSGRRPMAHPVEAGREEARELRRGSLSLWEAVGISIALMAPSMAANINPQGTVGLVGRAAPLAFVFATVRVLLVSYTFVRLCQ